VLRVHGSSLAPMSAWMLLQGLETLHVRMERHVQNARRVAEFLEAHPRVEWVNWPGLESSPYYALAKKYLRSIDGEPGASSVMTFGIKGGAAAGVKFIDGLQFLSHLANIGDAKSLVIHPASTTHRQLSEDEQRALLHATEDAKPRDRAIVVLLLYTALRLSELVALDVGDARVSARKGLLVVRSGKGDQYREVPLNRPVRAALEAWLKMRAKLVDVGEPALFVGPQGRRLSARAVDLVIRKVAARAGLQLSAHVLRHTCVTNLVRDGNDIVLVAELAGHRRLETTRRYSLPSAADRQAAMDRLEIEP